MLSLHYHKKSGDLMSIATKQQETVFTQQALCDKGLFILEANKDLQQKVFFGSIKYPPHLTINHDQWTS